MNSGGDQGGSSVSDEEWERFVRESAEGVRDAPKEPSARARMVTRRLREQPEPPAGWREHRPPRQKRRYRYVIGWLAALALLIVALRPSLVTDLFDGGDGTDAAPLAAESVRPTGPPPTDDAQGPTLDEPFRGSPAARWADGADGISVPEAKATGWMSRAQVRQALGQTRDFLERSSIDADVLRGERPRKAIAYINPHQEDMRRFLRTAFDHPGKKYDPTLLFSRFDPREARLVGDVVKTRGRMTYEVGERDALKVSTDVTYVYPVVGTDEDGADGTEVKRVIVRRSVVVSWDNPATVVTEPGTFGLVSFKTTTSNAGCDNTGGYLTPYTDDTDGTAQPHDGSTVDPFDRSRSLEEQLRADGDKGCGTATRS
ncbi:hypothetical protein GTY65_09340 [Streptomyces sp. SID8379]|uniref:hypothetical protein n=1 Tax=unclassified Streptomyces TaxID=2593676 RepID=UPI0003610072|nr:hypothetical protein [Streptomyces sp. HmicA12]MYW64275.1 hypothetical protein [Streptomyces sp. SID8379]